MTRKLIEADLKDNYPNITAYQKQFLSNTTNFMIENLKCPKGENK